MGAVVALEMAGVLLGGFRLTEEPATAAMAEAAAKGVQYSNAQEVGKLLYTQYVYPIEIAAVILLVAMIAAIALTLRQRKDSKFVDASEQVRVKARDRMQLVKVAATRKAEASPAAEPEQAK